jgi:hypothetical protein
LTSPLFAASFWRATRRSRSHGGSTASLSSLFCTQGHLPDELHDFGTFLNLKGNTMNANFRQDQFGHTSDIAASDLPVSRTPLPDGQHWKRRRHARDAFTSATTDAEAADLETNSRVQLGADAHQSFADAAQRTWCAHVGDCACAQWRRAHLY